MQLPANSTPAEESTQGAIDPLTVGWQRSPMATRVRRKATNPAPRQNIPLRSIERTLHSCVLGAGKILTDYFGKPINPREKENASSIVCDADLAAESYVIKRLRAEFPTHNIISEESGRLWNGSELTWVIDPLDGTSNFVAGLPWFGVQVGLLHGDQPICAAMYLPIERAMYSATSGKGAFRNGKRTAVTVETNLRNILCAFGFDPTPSAKSPRTGRLLMHVAGHIRNTRATNSLVDFCYTVDGRLGACINLKAKIWDLVPVALILPEAGGLFTDVRGHPIRFNLSASGFQRNYTLLGASTILHSELTKVVSKFGSV
jgi:myo-inositol-1(or 4)-monophosphatase